LTFCSLKVEKSWHFVDQPSTLSCSCSFWTNTIGKELFLNKFYKTDTMWSNASVAVKFWHRTSSKLLAVIYLKEISRADAPVNQSRRSTSHFKSAGSMHLSI
jgi:hypothetical protein